MEILGFIFEWVLFGVGLYIYRFSIGKIPFHSTQQPIAERFRKENGGWMRIAGLLLMAIMAVEIALHLFQMFKK
jgi:hypothetical protein